MLFDDAMHLIAPSTSHFLAHPAASAATRAPSPDYIMTSEEAVVGEGSMELELLRGQATEEKTDGGEDRGDHRRQAALELASLLAEARCVGRTSIKEGDFRSWKGDFRKRLHGLEVSLAHASGHSEVRMDPSIYSGMQDRDGEMHNPQPNSWYSQMQEAHDRTCGCGDVTRHFRRSSVPSSSSAPRSSSKQRAAQPRQGRRASK
jgi:hypothetical protein